MSEWVTGEERRRNLSQKGSGRQEGRGPCHRGSQGSREKVDTVIKRVRGVGRKWTVS